ncbi:hypothetical protein [Thermocrinis sp.]
MVVEEVVACGGEVVEDRAWHVVLVWHVALLWHVVLAWHVVFA